MAVQRKRNEHDQDNVDSLTADSGFRESIGQPQEKSTSGLRKAHHDYVGKTINAEDGKSLGRVVDLMVDLRGGQVAYTVVSLDGASEKGDVYRVLPWGVIVGSSLSEDLSSTATPHQLAMATTFPKNRWPAMTDAKWCRDVYAAFDKKPYWHSEDPLDVPSVERFSKVVGMSVRNTKNESLGEIEDLVVQPSDGRIAYAVLSFGGSFLPDSKSFAIPTSSLQLDADGTKPLLAATKESLENAPGFDKDDWPSYASDEFLTKGMTRTPDTSDRDRMMSPTDGKSMPALSVIKSSHCLGRKVTNGKGEEIGKIDELMIDLPAGRVAYAVVSAGGFLGITGRLCAVPAEAFRPNTADNSLGLDVDKDRMKKAPVYTPGDHPVPCDRAWLGTVYEYYGVRPYWNLTDLSSAR